MICEILLTRPDHPDGQIVGARIKLENGRLSGVGDPMLLRSVFNHANSPNIWDDPISADQDPEAWFKALPMVYDGMMVNARIVPDAVQASDPRAELSKIRFKAACFNPEEQRVPTGQPVDTLSTAPEWQDLLPQWRRKRKTLK